MRPTITIEIPEDAWEPAHEDNEEEGERADDRLITTIVINRTPMHLEAWAVENDGDNIQQHPAYPDDLSNLASAVGADGHFDTTTINGRDYVLVASPHC